MCTRNNCILLAVIHNSTKDIQNAFLHFHYRKVRGAQQHIMLYIAYPCIYNKQRCSVKHNIHIINIFINLWLHVSIH